jgi:ABC-type Fe3+/spermidine/putrescine transport system ATPase subunit/molybdopterin-binding protein
MMPGGDTPRVAAVPHLDVALDSGPARFAIETAGLIKKYGDRTVVDVDSLGIIEGEVLAILGPNGAGKTTLFRLLALIERPDAGWIKYFGTNVNIHDLATRRRAAAVFQRPLLFQGSVEENVGYGLRFRRLSRKEVKAKVHATLDFMGIARLAGVDMRTLSGGEMQRVALARALVLEPEILFLDEPTSNLDVHVRRRFREDLRRVVEHLAATVVIITHEHNEALALAQRVAVVNEGKVVQIGTPQEVFTHPQNAFVADFTGAETIWHGVVTANDMGLCTVRTRAGLVMDAVADLPVGAEVAVAMRPEDVALTLPGAGSGAAAGATAGAGAGRAAGDSRAVTSVRNRWPGVVAGLTLMGPFVRVAVRLDCDPDIEACFGGEGEVISLITRASADEMAIALGDRVTASVKATALNVLAG